MSEATHSPGLWPVHGDGVLARHGNLILLSSLESGQFVDVLLDLLDQVASAGSNLLWSNPARLRSTISRDHRYSRSARLGRAWPSPSAAALGRR